MRDAVARLHPEIETMIDDHRRLRWRLPSSQSAAIGISPLEASDLEFCLQLLMQHHQRGRARNLRMLLRSEEHTSELQSLMRISYAVFCLKKQKAYLATS